MDGMAHVMATQKNTLCQTCSLSVGTDANDVDYCYRYKPGTMVLLKELYRYYAYY